MFFYECISIKVTEQKVNPIIVFVAHFKIWKVKVKRLEKLRSDGVVINLQNTTIFEPLILTDF